MMITVYFVMEKKVPLAGVDASTRHSAAAAAAAVTQY